MNKDDDNVLIVTGAITGRVEATNTTIKNIRRTARGYRRRSKCKSVIRLMMKNGCPDRSGTRERFVNRLVDETWRFTTRSK
nr:transposase [Arthrobacter sp. E3]